MTASIALQCETYVLFQDRWSLKTGFIVCSLLPLYLLPTPSKQKYWLIPADQIAHTIYICSWSEVKRFHGIFCQSVSSTLADHSIRLELSLNNTHNSEETEKEKIPFSSFCDYMYIACINVNCKGSYIFAYSPYFQKKNSKPKNKRSKDLGALLDSCS